MVQGVKTIITNKCIVEEKLTKALEAVREGRSVDKIYREVLGGWTIDYLWQGEVLLSEKRA